MKFQCQDHITEPYFSILILSSPGIICISWAAHTIATHLSVHPLRGSPAIAHTLSRPLLRQLWSTFSSKIVALSTFCLSTRIVALSTIARTTPTLSRPLWWPMVAVTPWLRWPMAQPDEGNSEEQCKLHLHNWLICNCNYPWMSVLIHKSKGRVTNIQILLIALEAILFKFGISYLTSNISIISVEIFC